MHETGVLSVVNKICKIDDTRLNNYTSRMRNGRIQVFYTGNDSRDFDRYRRDQYPDGRGGRYVNNVEMHDKPDTLRIKPPKNSYYSELIEGEWWWVEGCAECNGEPRDWMTYVECDKHDVCRSCKTKTEDLPEGVSRWGGRDGWLCDTCNAAEHEEEKQEALAKMPDKEDFDAWDFHGVDEITCPYCAYEFSDSFESADSNDEEHECPRCDNTFIVTAVPSLTFDCSRIK